MSKSSGSRPQTICKACKIETSHDLFEKPENLRVTKELLSEVGFTADSFFIELIKEKTAGLCSLCGEIEIFRLALMSVIVDETDGETRECIRKLINALTSLVEESVWIECKRTVYDEINKSRLGGRASWRLFMRLCHPREQPQHVDDVERGLMQFLHSRRYSLSDLAFIFGRSKETVHRQVSKEALS